MCLFYSGSKAIIKGSLFVVNSTWSQWKWSHETLRILIVWVFLFLFFFVACMRLENSVEVVVNIFLEEERTLDVIPNMVKNLLPIFLTILWLQHWLFVIYRGVLSLLFWPLHWEWSGEDHSSFCRSNIKCYVARHWPETEKILCVSEVHNSCVFHLVCIFPGLPLQNKVTEADQSHMSLEGWIEKMIAAS